MFFLWKGHLFYVIMVVKLNASLRKTFTLIMVRRKKMVFNRLTLISLLFVLGMFVGSEILAADDFVVRSESGQGPSSVEASEETVSQSLNKAGGQRWIVAVGICKFADTRLSQLTYCVDDARSISSYFKSDGVPEKQIVLLVDENARKESVMASLQRVSDTISSDDTLFFFYSSHGAGDDAGKTYFITFDTVIDDLATTALPMQELKNAVQKIKCRDIVMMIDTCHSGGAKSLGRQDEKAFDKLVRTADRGTRVAILTSSRTHEISIESDRWKHGAFTYFMLEGLSGSSDNFPRDGHVSVTELFDYVMVAVPRATDRAQHPSGKFSYNWPGKKEQAVKVGQISTKRSSNSGSGWWGGNAEGKGQAEATGEKWQNVIDAR